MLIFGSSASQIFKFLIEHKEKSRQCRRIPTTIRKQKDGKAKKQALVIVFISSIVSFIMSYRKYLTEDELIKKFIFSKFIKAITKDLTGEEYLEHKREDGKKYPIDLVVKTKNYTIGYEFYSEKVCEDIKSSDIIRKIKS